MIVRVEIAQIHLLALGLPAKAYQLLRVVYPVALFQVYIYQRQHQQPRQLIVMALYLHLLLPRPRPQVQHQVKLIWRQPHKLLHAQAQVHHRQRLQGRHILPVYAIRTISRLLFSAFFFSSSSTLKLCTIAACSSA